MEAQRREAANWFRNLQDIIVAAFEGLEDQGQDAGVGARFARTATERPQNGGGGIMAVLRSGVVFEKVGVNWSEVHGTLSGKAQAAMTARGVPGIGEDARFWASGISLVAHLKNPHVPAVHMNTRMFWTPSAWWFGGGTDLNPAITYDEDTQHFHQVLKSTCDGFDQGYYPRFKAWADQYFYIPHRGRARGVGGIFYDDLNSGDWSADFAFTKAVGESFLPAYLPLVQRRQTQTWSEADREAQLVHRGLYAEYNLLYDRGTKFGLETGHNPDAVLMSLPPLARWP